MGGSRIHSTLHTVEPLRLLGWTRKAYGTYAVHNWTLTDLNGDTEVGVEESMSGVLTHLFKKVLTRMLAKDMTGTYEVLNGRFAEMLLNHFSHFIAFVKVKDLRPWS